MLKSKLYQKLLIASIVGTMCISSGVMAFASTTKTATGKTTKTSIAAKSIRKGLAAKSKVTATRPAGKSIVQKGNPIENIIKAQITAGVITQAEADKITAYLKAKGATEKAKVDAMTAAQKKAYFESNKVSKDSIFAELVGAGLLTTDQSTTIQAALPTLPAGGVQPGKGFGGDKQKGVSIADLLSAQVTASVITQDTSDKVTAYLKTKEDGIKAEKIKVDAMTAAEKTVYIQTKEAAKKVARDAEKAKIDAMTEAERTAYLAANKEAKPSIFADLVTAGILTQDQATALQAAMHQGPLGNKGHKK